MWPFKKREPAKAAPPPDPLFPTVWWTLFDASNMEGWSHTYGDGKPGPAPHSSDDTGAHGGGDSGTH